MFEYIVGNIHLILLAVHGGKELRQNDDDKTDLYTREMCELWIKKWEMLYGVKPSAIIVHTHKSFMNANRPLHLQSSLESQQLWKEVHQTIQNEIERWDNPLLIDIHGHQQTNDIIYRGTMNGKSFQAPTNWDILWNNLPAIEPKWCEIKGENPKYRGGYNTQTYLNTIQLEFPLNLRENPGDFLEKMCNFLWVVLGFEKMIYSS